MVCKRAGEREGGERKREGVSKRGRERGWEKGREGGREG